MEPKSDHVNLSSWMWWLEHTGNLSTQEAEAGGSVRCHPGLHSISNQKHSCCEAALRLWVCQPALVLTQKGITILSLQIMAQT